MCWVEISVFVPNLTVYKGLSHCEVWWGGVGGHYSESEILSFVELNKHPLVSCLNSTTARRVYSSPIKHHVCLIPEFLILFGSLLNIPHVMVVGITSSLHVSIAAWANKLNHLSFAQASHLFFFVFYTYWVMQHMGNTKDIRVHMSYLIEIGNSLLTSE
jgi:hypothetical protein